MLEALHILLSCSGVYLDSNNNWHLGVELYISYVYPTLQLKHLHQVSIRHSNSCYEGQLPMLY